MLYKNFVIGEVDLSFIGDTPMVHSYSYYKTEIVTQFLKFHEKSSKLFSNPRISLKVMFMLGGNNILIDLDSGGCTLLCYHNQKLGLSLLLGCVFVSL